MVCKHVSYIKKGKTRHGNQRFKCSHCGHSWRQIDIKEYQEYERLLPTNIDDQAAFVRRVFNDTPTVAYWLYGICIANRSIQFKLSFAEQCGFLGEHY